MYVYFHCILIIYVKTPTYFKIIENLINFMKAIFIRKSHFEIEISLIVIMHFDFFII